MELLNALRREGLIAATPVGWRWDIAAVHAHLSRSEPAQLLDETATLVALWTARHAALYSMGHPEEADEEYRRIEKLRPGVVPRADAR